MRFAPSRRLLGLAQTVAARRSELMWLGAPFTVDICSLAVAGLAEEVFEGGIMDFDFRFILLFKVSGDLATLAGPSWLPEMLRGLTSQGSTVVLALVLAITLGYLAITGERAGAVLVLASVLGGQILSTLILLAFARPRPNRFPGAPEVFAASFPSGHAMLSAVTYLTLAAFLARINTGRAIRKYVMGVGISLTVLIGISRVALGVHWPNDVLARWCIGAAWAGLCTIVALRPARRGKIDRPA